MLGLHLELVFWMLEPWEPPSPYKQDCAPHTFCVEYFWAVGRQTEGTHQIVEP